MENETRKDEDMRTIVGAYAHMASGGGTVDYVVVVYIDDNGKQMEDCIYTRDFNASMVTLFRPAAEMTRSLMYAARDFFEKNGNGSMKLPWEM